MKNESKPLQNFESQRKNISKSVLQKSISHKISKDRIKSQYIKPKLQKLKNLLTKLFLSEPISSKDTLLDPMELSLIKAVFKKKKMKWNNTMNFDAKTLIQIGNSSTPKKKEDQLKFVIKRCIRQMQADFKLWLERTDPHFSQNYPQFKKNRDFHFYDFHFGRIAKRENIRLENFFHFRTRAYRYSRVIPNSVTKKSLLFWKQNPGFIEKMVTVIRNSFRTEFIDFNIRKINALVLNWENKLDDLGDSEGLAKILTSMKKRGCKLPWTMAEVNCAIKNTFEVLK